MTKKECPSTYSNGEVNAAGLIIRDHGKNLVFTAELDHALDVLGAWRATHTQGLQTVYMALRERAKRLDSKALSYQRLKRVESIVVKLQRNPNMKLSTVQDIGGCRAVLSDVQMVRKLAPRYKNLVRDYIAHPKPDGYRSIHIVERYEPTSEKHLAVAGRRIEVQIRSALQHAWATAVETVDSLLGQNLKTGGGKAEWKRFFALASSVIANTEGCPIVPDTPEQKQELRDEIRDLAERLDVFITLQALATSVENVFHVTRKEPAAAYVLVLDLKARVIRPKAFPANQLAEAAAFYLEQEKTYYGDPSVQVVQVSVAKVQDLKRAFPNYYLNATAFLEVVQKAI